MPSKVAEAYVEIRSDQRKLDREIDRMRGSLTGRLRKIGGVAGKALTAGLTAGLAGGVAGLGVALKLFAEQDKVERRLEAVIRATGGAAGFTAGELKRMAGELQKVTRFGDETTLAAQAILATFKQIKGDTFRQATEAAMDMSIVMGQSLTASITQVGKALNDPILGVGALARVGVQFTEKQKGLIASLVRTNQVAKAQAVILAELNGQFGGAAQADAESFEGKMVQLKNSLGDLGEVVGGAVAPAFARWADEIKGVVEAQQGLAGSGSFGAIEDAEKRVDEAAALRKRRVGGKRNIDEIKADLKKNLKSQGKQHEIARDAAFRIAKRSGGVRRFLDPTALPISSLDAQEIGASDAALDTLKLEESILRAELARRQRETGQIPGKETGKTGAAPPFAPGAIGRAVLSAIAAKDLLPENMKQQLDALPAKFTELRDKVAGAREGFAEWQEDLKRGAAIVEQVKTPLERYKDTLEELNRLKGVGAISEETRRRGLAQAAEQLPKLDFKKLTGPMVKFFENLFDFPEKEQVAARTFGFADFQQQLQESLLQGEQGSKQLAESKKQSGLLQRVAAGVKKLVEQKPVKIKAKAS